MRVLMRSVAANLLLVSPVAAQTYEPVQTQPQIAGSPATMTPLRLGDDNTAKVDLGFEFTYWGQTFTSAWVSSNGFVSFQGGNHLCCNGYPVEQAQRNTIYGLWTDLISPASNPYYARKPGSILFGWYDTAEYGTQNKYTFEIGLKDDNSIQFNYGAVGPLAYHLATAGITGPGSDDNILLFYGRDPSPLRNQSGVLKWTVPVTVDCTVTPLDPSCPPQMVAPVQVITTQPVTTVQQAYAADVQADRAEALAASTPEPVQEITQVAPAATTATASAEAVTTSVTERVAQLVAAERLSPEQVAALAVPAPTTTFAQGADSAGAQATGPDGMTFGFTSGGAQTVMNPAQTGAASTTSVVVVDTSSPSSSSSPASVTNTLEALNMAAAPAPMTSMQVDQGQTANTMAEGQGETIATIANVPGFSAYTQVVLQDRPDFYAPRDIYKNRRLRDANFEMYRLTRTNTDKLQEMIDVQYQR